MRTLLKQTDWIGYLYIAGTILCTVYGQIVVKWQVRQAGAMPVATIDKLYFVLNLLLNPWIISGLTGAFLAFVFWIGAMTKFDLSYAYPFTSLSFVLVLALSTVFFQEGLPLLRIAGLVLIIIGVTVASQG